MGISGPFKISFFHHQILAMRSEPYRQSSFAGISCNRYEHHCICTLRMARIINVMNFSPLAVKHCGERTFYDSVGGAVHNNISGSRQGHIREKVPRYRINPDMGRSDSGLPQPYDVGFLFNPDILISISNVKHVSSMSLKFRPELFISPQNDRRPVYFQGQDFKSPKKIYKFVVFEHLTPMDCYPPFGCIS